MAFFNDALVWVRGGGDLASGVVYRLQRAGFPVMVSELEKPLFVRRMVSYGEAVYSGSITVDGVTARLASDPRGVQEIWDAGAVAVLVDAGGTALRAAQPVVVVDARMAKVNLGTTIDEAPLVIGLGPGFRAGEDCHAVVETKRGHDLGRVIYAGPAEADTGVPGKIGDKSAARVLRAPSSGHVRAYAEIGDSVTAGQRIADVNGEPILAPFAGVLRGLIHERVSVEAGMKIGDVDPRGVRANCFSISDKALAVGGGALEAVLAAAEVRPFLGRADYETSRSV